MKAKHIVMAALFGLCHVLGVTACSEDDEGPPAIVGEWEDEGDYHGWKDNFEIEDDLKGEGEFWVQYDGSTVYYCDYDLEAEKDGDVWVIDAECGDESAFDFEMECEVDGDELECEGTDGYADDWEWTFEEQ